MPRKVELWVGKDDDAAVPPRVKIRVFERCNGLCHRCGRKIGPADKWILEHMIALSCGGRNAEDNLDLTCAWCVASKNADDAAIKSKIARIRKRDLGIKKTKRPFPGSRNSIWKKPVGNGNAVRR